MSTIRKPRAFTLIELLIVIVIIAILIAMLLPAIQAAREAARMAQCRNNMHQLGIALHAYHDVYKLFPPAAEQVGAAATGSAYGSGANGNWVIHLLPFMDEGNLYHSVSWRDVALSGGLTAYDASTGPKWNAFTSKEIPTLLCPSDKNNVLKYSVSGSSNKFGTPPPWTFQTFGRLNYAANGCLAAPFNYGYGDSRGLGLGVNAYPCGSPTQAGWNLNSPWSWNSRGVMGYSSSVGIKHITDGTSKTVALWEIRTGVSTGDFRGIWADGRPAASGIWFHVWGGPNLCDSGDDCGSWPAVDRAWPAATRALTDAHLKAECMPMYSSSSGPVTGQPRSLHVGGANAVFCDGSVRFVGDLIEVGYVYAQINPDTGTPDGIYGWNMSAYAQTYMRTWERINASADGLPVEEDKIAP